MVSKIDLEKEFFHTANNLETKKQVKQEFLKKISALSEDWIDDKFRFGIFGLK